MTPDEELAEIVALEQARTCAACGALPTPEAGTHRLCVCCGRDYCLSCLDDSLCDTCRDTLKNLEARYGDWNSLSDDLQDEIADRIANTRDSHE